LGFVMRHTDATQSTVVATDFFSRRDRLNMTQDELAEEAGVDRDTVRAVEKGGGRIDSRRKIDEALTRAEDEAGLRVVEPVAPPNGGEPQLMEFEVTGDFGVRVVVKGPVANARELEESVSRLIRDMKGESRKDNPA
jgi:DNA-binding XRE family transcriptional regulator